MPRATAAKTLDVAADLRIAVLRLARRMRQQDVGDLSPTPSTALATIAREGPMTLGALARSENLSAPTITRVVERLIADALVARTVDPADRRVSHVATTAAGRRHLETNRERRTEWLHDRLAHLMPSEVATLAEAARLLELLACEAGPPAAP